MDGEAIGTLLIIAFWVISALTKAMNRGKKKQAQQAPTSTPAPPHPARAPAPTTRRSAPKQTLGPDTVGDLLREMISEIKGKPQSEEAATPPWQEPQVLSEHQQSAGEHRHTDSETSWSASEHSWSFEEHRRSAGEHSSTLSELRGTASEHRGSASEHRRGDVVAARRGSAEEATRRRPAHRAGSVRAALASRGSLARAMVLKEILGPPVSLRRNPAEME